MSTSSGTSSLNYFTSLLHNLLNHFQVTNYCCNFLQLRNIQSVIRLTKENIDALNAQFAGFQHPPLMYIAVSKQSMCNLTL